MSNKLSEARAKLRDAYNLFNNDNNEESFMSALDAVRLTIDHLESAPERSQEHTGSPIKITDEILERAAEGMKKSAKWVDPRPPTTPIHEATKPAPVLGLSAGERDVIIDRELALLYEADINMRTALHRAIDATLAALAEKGERR